MYRVAENFIIDVGARVVGCSCFDVHVFTGFSGNAKA
jgi:hypothetical protein